MSEAATLVVGCSPSAPVEIERARAEWDVRWTITTNGGVLLCEPDVWLAHDRVGVERYAEAVQAIGCGVVCHEDHEERVQPTFPRVEPVRGRRFERIAFQPLRQSGPWLVEYAAHEAGETTAVVVLAGFSGYDPDGPLYAEAIGEPERRPPRERLELMNAEMGATLTRVCRKYPWVTFRPMGPTRYKVDAENWLVADGRA